MTPIEEAKAAGYSDDEINAYLRPKVAEAMDAGYSQDEVNKHLGVTPPPTFDGATVQAHGEASHAAYGKPVTSFMDALEAGWQISTAGLQVRGAAPSKVLAENAPMASRMANNVAMMVGDLPAMAGGAVAGAVGGAEGGPPGMVIGGVAGAMALPTALRGLMMDAYEKKQFANFGDFWERVGPIMLDTAKSWVTGAATGSVGAAVGPAAGALGRAAPSLAPALSSPTVLAATKTAAEIGTLTTVGAAMEGHAPSAQDFLDAAVLLGGLHFATAGAAKLRSIYAEKGIPPAAVVQDAERDVTVKQDLLSDREMPRLYEGSESGVSGPELTGSETPQTVPLSGETIGKGDLWRLAPDQLDTMLGEKSESDHDKLVRALGSEEMVKEFNRLDRKQNSSDPQRADEGSREFDAKFGSLTPEQERLIYGSGETDAQTEDIKSVLDAHNARSPDDPNEAAYEAALAMRRTTPAEILQVPNGNAPSSAQAAWVQLRNAYEDMANTGVPPDQIGNRIIGALVERGWSPEDAKEVIGSFGEAMRQENSRSATTPAIARIIDETGVSSEGKTPDQFFDAITDKLSQDEVSALQARMEPEHEATYAEFERAAKAADVPIEGARSLEDMENEYRQEVAATAASGSNVGGQQSGRAGQPAVTGQTGGGPVGGAAGIAGRPGAQAATGGGGNTGGPNQPPTGVGGPGGPGTTPEQRILAHMSIGEAASTRPWTWARLYTDIVNKIFPIEQAVTRIAGKNVLAAADDPGKLARLLSGATGIADRFLRFDTLDFATRQPNGPGLETILAPWRDNLNGFRAYIASRHALDLESQGIKTGFDLNDAQDVVTNGAQFQAAADELTAFSNRMAAYIRDSGVISPAAYTEMVNTRAYYVPFQRVIDKIGQGGGGTGGTLQPANPIHGQVGSERMVIDPIESIVRNAYLFTQMAERNVTGTKLVDLLLSNNEAEPTSMPPPPRTPMATLRALGVGMSPEEMEALVQASRPTMGAEVRIFRAGTLETYRVDPEIATAVKGLDSQNMGDLERMLRPFANSLRAGAVLQPDFVARHTIRDFLYAVVTHPGFFSPLDMVRGFTSLAVKDADYQDWRSSGGAGVSMVSLDRRYLQNSIDQMTDTGLLERAWNVIANPTSTPLQMAGAAARVPLDAARKFLISPMQMAVEFAESATHIGTFIKAKNKMLANQPAGTPLTREQIIEAGFASRDVAVDAARMGAKMRTLNALSAFSNIAVQDTDRVVRAFVNNPLSTALKIAGVISLPSALTWMNGHGDSRYDDAPDWEKDLFWVIPTDRWRDGPDDGRPRDLVRTVDGRTQVNDGITFRVPKPWGMGLIFGSGLERSLDSFAGAKPDAFKHFAASMAAVSVPSIIPNAITPMIEQYANRSIFTNRTLVPDQMTKELPEYQYTPYTTETSKALGSLMGAFPGLRGASISEGSFGGVARALSSPILMENYLRAWTGNLGMYALQAVDKGLRSAGMLPDPVKPDDTLADIPFVKAFIVRYPTASTQPIQDFSDEYKRNKVFFDTWQAQAKEGNMEAMRHIQDLGGPMMFVQLDGIHQALGEHAKIVRDIYKNPSIPSDEKRQLIDTTYWRMTELAKTGNNTLAAAKTALTAQGGP